MYLVNKFYDNGDSESPSGETLEIMSCYATYLELHNQYKTQLAKIISQMLLSGQFKNEIKIVAELIDNQCPGLPEASQKLKTSLDKVVGWTVAWQHYEQGEIIGSSSQELRDGLITANVIRGPETFRGESAVLLDSIVGTPPFTHDYGVYMGLGLIRDSKTPVWQEFSPMFEVQFVP